MAYRISYSKHIIFGVFAMIFKLGVHFSLLLDWKFVTFNFQKHTSNQITAIQHNFDKFPERCSLFSSISVGGGGGSWDDIIAHLTVHFSDDMWLRRKCQFTLQFKVLFKKNNNIIIYLTRSYIKKNCDLFN